MTLILLVMRCKCRHHTGVAILIKASMSFSILIGFRRPFKREVKRGNSTIIAKGYSFLCPSYSV